MRDLALIGIGIVIGITIMAIIVMVADNREWVRNLKAKHKIK